MNITLDINGSSMKAELVGRLDTTTAPQLEAELASKLDGITELTLDFDNLAYISSAGLRVLLMCQKKMNATNGKMVVKNPNELVMAVFEATGFSDILTIEQ